MTLSEFIKKWSPQISEKQRQAFMDDAAEMFTPPDNAIWVESVISHRDTRPVVSVRLGSYSFQVSPDDARKIGRDFYEVAGGAENDAFLFQRLTASGAPPEAAFSLIRELRDWRKSRMNQPLVSYKAQ
jgi:hypothetical protein